MPRITLHPMKAIVPVLSALLFTVSSSAAAGDGMEVVKVPPDHPGSIRFDSCARPNYPEEALKQKQQGEVTLRFLIGADGVVKKSLVQKSSGFPALDEAALAGIAKCRFNPPMVDGKPVDGWTAIVYVWKP